MILTEEEMDKVILESIPEDMDIYFPLHRKQLEAIKKAQLKKVVEWGGETCPHDLGEGTQCYKHACDMCWQSLKSKTL